MINTQISDVTVTSSDRKKLKAASFLISHVNMLTKAEYFS